MLALEDVLKELDGDEKGMRFNGKTDEQNMIKHMHQFFKKKDITEKKIKTLNT